MILVSGLYKLGYRKFSLKTGPEGGREIKLQKGSISLFELTRNNGAKKGAQPFWVRRALTPCVLETKNNVKLTYSYILAKWIVTT